jgi:hypothetical protein
MSEEAQQPISYARLSRVSSEASGLAAANTKQWEAPLAVYSTKRWRSSGEAQDSKALALETICCVG